MNFIENKRIFNFLGLMYMGIGILGNEKILSYYFSPDGEINNLLIRGTILLGNILLIIWGFVTIKKGSKKEVISANFAILGCFLLALFLFLGNKVLHRAVFANNHFQLMGEMVNRVETNEKVVALTYDDGPNEEYTPELLEVLERNNVKATFFLLGKNIKKNLNLARLMVEKGHELGSHAYDHEKLVFKSPSYVRTKLQKSNEMLRRAGVEGEIYFRAPYGEKFIILPFVLDQMGMKHILFDVEPDDWRGKESDDVVEHVLTNVKPGSIILLHDGYQKAGSKVAQTTQMVIVGLKEKGYQFKTVSGLLQLSQ